MVVDWVEVVDVAAGGDTEIMETVAEFLFATYKFPFAASKQIPAGELPTLRVPVTEFDVPFISDTVLEFAFVT